MAEVPLSYLERVKPQSKLATWAWSPVIVLRVSLIGSYLISVYASMWAFLAGVPIFDLTAPHGYTAIWAGLFGASAAVAAIASTTDRWQKVEKWASGVLTIALITYTIPMNVVGFILHDLNRQFLGALSLGLLVLPATRYVYLALQTGKIRAEDVPPNAE